MRSVDMGLGLAPLGFGPLGTRSDIEDELDGVMVAVRGFHTREPDQVMREIAAYSARLTELANLLVRVEGTRREYRQLRTLQIERLLNELDRQFKIASRLVEMRRQDLALLEPTRGSGP